MRTPGGIARHFDARHPVVLNLEGVTKDAALRLVDFLGGVAYAQGRRAGPHRQKRVFAGSEYGDGGEHRAG